MGETETKTAAGASGGGGKNYSVHPSLFSALCPIIVVGPRWREGGGEGPKGQWDPIIAERNCPLEAHCDCGIEKHGKVRVIERSLLSPVISHCFGPAQKGERERRG